MYFIIINMIHSSQSSLVTAGIQQTVEFESFRIVVARLTKFYLKYKLTPL